MGFWLSAVVLVCAAIQELNSAWLFLSTKDLIPGKPESLFEIGYMLYKRSSIFFISTIIAINGFGLCMVYFITFSEIVESIFVDILGDNADKNKFNEILTEKTTWTIVLAFALLPVCLKKELQELHIVSTSLFVSICIFMVVLCLQVFIFGNGTFDVNLETGLHEPLDFSEF